MWRQWWPGHGPLLTNAMIMKLHVCPVSRISVQALTVSLISEDVIPLFIFAKKEESNIVSDVTAQNTSTLLSLTYSIMSWGFSLSHSQALLLRWGVASSLKQILERCVLSASRQSIMSHPSSLCNTWSCGVIFKDCLSVQDIFSEFSLLLTVLDGFHG